MRTKFHVVVAVVAAALGAPALADELQPEVKNPAPAIALEGSGRAEADALNADPTWPGSESAAPAVALRSFRGETDAGSIVNDEPWASAVHGAAQSRVASR